MTANKVIGFLEWTLSSRVNPLFYMVTFISFFIGLSFTFFSSLPDVQNTLLYKYGVFGGVTIWGIALLVGSTLIFIGLRSKKSYFMKVGSMLNVLAWLFATFMYMQNGFWYALLSFALPFVFINGYLYLTASLNYLWSRIFTYHEY